MFVSITAHKRRFVSGLRLLTDGAVSLAGAVAERLGRTPAQVLLRWALQHGAAVIPTSRSPERSASNAALFNFALSEADMAELSGLAWFLAAPGNTPHVSNVFGIE